MNVPLYFYVSVLNEQTILMVVYATILLAIVSLWLQRNSPIPKKYQVPLGFVRKVFNCSNAGYSSFACSEVINNSKKQ